MRREEAVQRGREEAVQRGRESASRLYKREQRQGRRLRTRELPQGMPVVEVWQRKTASSLTLQEGRRGPRSARLRISRPQGRMRLRLLKVRETPVGKEERELRLHSFYQRRPSYHPAG